MNIDFFALKRQIRKIVSEILASGLLTAFILFPCAHADSDVQPLLRKGINLSSWFANAPRQPLNARDFAQLQQAGFDNVRLPFNPELYGFSLAATKPVVLDFTALDAAIRMAGKFRLAVTLDLHPRKEFMERLENSPQAEQRFSALWRALSVHYHNYPASLLAFELLNEPQYYHKAGQYNRLAKTVVKTIRAEDANRLIIVAAPFGSSIAGLEALNVIVDPHIAYDFHFYEPYIVTHQGMLHGFEHTMLRYFHGVPYPSALAIGDVSLFAADAPDRSIAAQEIDEYRSDKWDHTVVENKIARAARWGKMHQVRLICGEFGVFRNHIDSASRYRWISDARTSLEKNGVGWQLWDYADLFGVTYPVGDTVTDPVDGSIRLAQPETGQHMLEKSALLALGLQH